jgi:hypothetical protein
LVFLSIGGREAGAIADLDVVVVEAPVGAYALLGSLGDGLEDALQRGLGQASARLAVRAGIVTDFAPAQRGQPGDELTDGIRTGAAGIEHLPQKGPKGDPEAINALSAVRSFVGRREPMSGKPVLKEGSQLVWAGGQQSASGLEGLSGGVKPTEEVSSGKHISV